jgi:hypothetical protein
VSKLGDATPPVFGATVAKVQGATVRVTFSAADTAAVSYECKLDDGEFATCTSPCAPDLLVGTGPTVGQPLTTTTSLQR